jgi:hypothetical protein
LKSENDSRSRALRRASRVLEPAKARKSISMVTVWYDPVSSVVDGVDIGGSTAFVRKP